MAARGKPFKPDLLMRLVVLYTWVGIWRIQEIVPILGKVQMPILVELLTIGVFFADASPLRKVKWMQSPLAIMLIVFFGIMVVGLPSSLWPGKGVTFITKDFIPYLVLMVILATSTRDTADLEWYAFAHLMSATAFATYAFFFCPIAWDGRIAGLPFYDSNDFALLLNCSIPFALYFMRPGVPGRKRLLALFSLSMLVLMVIKSGSRGGFIGLIALVIYVLLWYRAVPARLRVGAVLAGAAIMVLFGSERYWIMMQSLLKPNDDYNMTEETGRKKIWLRGINYMVTHPIVGVGIRAFPQAEGQLSPIARQYAMTGKGIKWSVAHNSFVEIGAETGVIGLGLFVSMIGFSIGVMARLRKGSKKLAQATPTEAAFGQTLVGSFIAFSVSGFFVSAEYFAYLYVLFGFVFATYAVLRRRKLMPQTMASPQNARSPGQLPARKPRQRPQWLPTGS